MPSRPARNGAHGIPTDVPARHRAKIEEAAAWRGVPVRGFVIEAAVQEADLIIQKERLVELTRSDTELIMSLIDNPPGPNAAMRKAMRAHKRVIRG